MKIEALVEFDLDENFSDPEHPERIPVINVDEITTAIIGEIVKVKSGDYENLLVGTIVMVDPHARMYDQINSECPGPPPKKRES